MRGLLNHNGTTCYFNAVLQMLAHSQAFVRFIASGASGASGADQARDVRSETRDAIGKMTMGGREQDAPLDVSRLVDRVTSLSHDRILRDEQNDAHELFCVLVELMGDRRRVRIRNNHPQPSPSAPPMLEHWRAAFDAFGESHTHGMAALFYGQLVVGVTCGWCKRSSAPGSEVFSALTLSLPLSPSPRSDRPCTVDELMRSNFCSETIEGRTCDACGRCAPAVRRTAIWRLPSVVVVCIKRFLPDGTGVRRDDVRMSKYLMLEPFVAPRSPASRVLAGHRYRLASVVCHQGSQGSGHYVAAGRGGRREPAWSVFDDASVRPLPGGLEHIPGGAVYMLAYERVQIRAINTWR
jgi:ubiquitin C-terminal hydrolase